MFFSLKPKEPWNKLARKYSKFMFLSYVGSPIIELGGHQYMQVEYFGPFDGPGPYPDVNIRGTLVLCDGISVVNDLSTARRVTELAILVLVHRIRVDIDRMERFATLTRPTPSTDDLLNGTAWYKEHQSILCRYVSEELLVSFIVAFEKKLAALDQRAKEAARVLQVLNATLQGRPVPAENIRALDSLYLRAQEWNLENTRALIEGGSHAGRMSQELSDHREDWIQDQQAAEHCEKASQAWEQIAGWGKESRESYEKTDYAHSTFRQIHDQRLEKILAKRIAVYAVPLVESAGAVTLPEEPELTDADLDRIVDSLPPLPERPPWQPSRVERAMVRILVPVSIVAGVLAVALSILKMIAVGPSFSTIAQALFFLSWILILPRYLKRL